LQLRDFGNKVPYLDNFSGDPFKIVHEQRTKQRLPQVEQAFDELSRNEVSNKVKLQE
jgi:hypothetical protein